MGAAILAGIVKDYTVTVCESDRKRAAVLKRRFRVSIGSLAEVVKNSRILIVAVKPQNFDAILIQLKLLCRKEHVIISIAAGITSRYMEKRLGANARIIRTMPNLPAQVGQGMTAVCKGGGATVADVKTTCRIFNCVGATVAVDEKWMDAVTAVSGSGPAYVFHFVEMFTNAARALGLDEKLSRDLVAQTLRGSLDLLEQSKEDAGTLRQRVTSKGGTTQAALEVFQKNKADKIFKEALGSAKRRARELAK